ncbi:zinc-dependent dehydrogenase [Dehalococcoides mccartyi]|uniref:zinc-dependent dehydrogenase n=1 Tax=Dehalococcoides mccartyi TaxID=61435 RepID=UPI0003C8784E|nr:zinc-dependent dehydrogenase [Dehalococcoides mccartyi]AHB12940.1 zinc-dependent alcohol dehydrogenase [Dehalococcoides mccartyi GY50]
MKAVLLEKPGELLLAEVATPSCPKGGVLLKVSCCAICGTDVKMFRRGHRDLKYPRVLGHEIAAEVVCSEHPDFKAGTRVQVYPGIACGVCPLCLQGRENLCGQVKIIGFNYDGGLAEYMALPPESLPGGLNIIPENVSDEEASLAEPLASCIHSQYVCRVGDGDRVLVLGAGPLGLLQTMLARYNGAEQVLVAEILPERVCGAELACPDGVIDLGKTSLKQGVFEQTGGVGVDVILIASSGVEVGELPSVLSPGGRINFFSGLPKDRSGFTIDANSIHYQELILSGSYGSTAADNAEAVRLIGQGIIPVKRLISRVTGISYIEEAFLGVERLEGLKTVIKFYK